MCPASVLLDADLSDKAARVFGVLALRAFGKSTVALSREELSASLRCSKSAAKRAVAELAERGHIEIVRTHNHPNSYVLRSTVFSAGPVASSAAIPEGNTVRACASCRRPCLRLTRAGICRGCKADSDLAARVRAIRSELGPGATPEQIAERLKQIREERGQRRLTARVRRVMEAVA
jgi:DNA-binding Lrp family transcriptional regulator